MASSTPSPSVARPLDAVRSIKAKLALLVGTSIVVAALVSEAGDRAGVPVWLTVPATVANALLVTQWLARGMTSPLREMTSAASAMATGDYSRRVTATSTDEVGQLAHAFNTMAADLASVDHQRRQLVATVSHELRTPLTAQRALLENLVDGVVTPDDAALSTALAQAERLSELVSDLLDLSRIDGGAARLRLTDVLVRDLVEAGLAEARASHAAGRGVRFATVVPDPSLVVEADSARLAQVLANLLDNAARHSPEGGLVTARAYALDSERWALEVSDEGPGIPPERVEQAFARFGSWDESGGGTGLGLAIASWVCELHGGSISAVPPQEGEPGARIRAVLPRRPAQPGPRATPARSLADPSTPPSATPASVKGTTTMTSVPADTPGSTPVLPPPPPAGTPGVPAPPFVDSLFGDLWPERGMTARPDLVIGSVVIGAVAAVVLPERRLGIAVFLVLMLCGALVLKASIRRTSRWTLASAVFCVGLCSLIVLRAAEWVAVLSVMVSGLLVTTALTDARGLLSMIGGAASWVLAGLRGLPLLGRTLGSMSRHTRLWPIVRTVALSAAALVIFGGLFASGDAVFGSWAQAIVPNLAVDSIVMRGFTAFVVGGTVLAATYVAINPPKVERLKAPAPRPVAQPWEWIVPVGLVVALFATFCVAQATAMFGGHDYLRRTTGLTYAEYVHQGFGQLTFATLLTLVTVAIAARKAPRDSAADVLRVRVVLGALCVLALVVVASALYRMDLYQEAYGFTVLRVLVIAFELWLGLLIVLVIVAGSRMSGWWLPRAALVSAASFLLVIGFANPEAWVAQRNIDRYHATGKLDAGYLSTLGADAAPTIRAGLPANVSACIISSQGLPEADDALEWNLGRVSARGLGHDPLPGYDGPSCRDLLSQGTER